MRGVKPAALPGPLDQEEQIVAFDAFSRPVKSSQKRLRLAVFGRAEAPSPALQAV